MVWQLDEPLADPAPLNVLYISELARRNGIKVLLSGAGATTCLRVPAARRRKLRTLCGGCHDLCAKAWTG